MSFYLHSMVGIPLVTYADCYIGIGDLYVIAYAWSLKVWVTWSAAVERQ